jgi:hypothetical protein
MSYLTGVANQRPLLRITAQVLLAFCCAAPLVLAFSSFVAYGVHTLMHWATLRFEPLRTVSFRPAAPGVYLARNGYWKPASNRPRVSTGRQTKSAPIQTSARTRGALTDRAGRDHHWCCLGIKSMRLHRDPQTRYERTPENNKRNISYHSDGPPPRFRASTTTAPRRKTG